MTKFINHLNAFGDSAGDSMSAHGTKYYGRGSMPKGKLQRYPGEVANISTGNRRLAKSKYGTGGGSGTSTRGQNAFSKGK